MAVSFTTKTTPIRWRNKEWRQHKKKQNNYKRIIVFMVTHIQTGCRLSTKWNIQFHIKKPSPTTYKSVSILGLSISSKQQINKQMHRRLRQRRIKYGEFACRSIKLQLCSLHFIFPIYKPRHRHVNRTVRCGFFY